MLKQKISESTAISGIASIQQAVERDVVSSQMLIIGEATKIDDKKKLAKISQDITDDVVEESIKSMIYKPSIKIAKISITTILIYPMLSRTPLKHGTIIRTGIARKKIPL